jgi:phenylacetate-CoA ligase
VRLERFNSTDPELVDKLNAFAPNILVAYASVLEVLSSQAERLRLPDLRQLSNSSERLTQTARRRIEEALGAPVLDHYGTGECLWLSDACHTHGGVHVNLDWAILEVVDEENQPVPQGQVGAKVLVTNLANRVQPFLRYEVGDRVAWATEPCSCGSHLPRLDRIEGRAADLFRLAIDGEMVLVPGVLFHTASDSLGYVREWQAIQQADHVVIRVELLSGRSQNATAVEHQLQAALREQGLPSGVATRVVVVDRILPDAITGKQRRMIPLPSRDAPVQHDVLVERLSAAS